MVTKGATVVVVKGYKVPKGTSGTVFWTGVTKFGPRIGFKDAEGTVFWTSESNIKVVGPVAAAAVADVAVADEPTPGASDAVLAKLAVLEAKVAALEAALAAKTAASPVAEDGGPEGRARNLRGHGSLHPDEVDPAEIAAFTR